MATSMGISSRLSRSSKRSESCTFNSTSTALVSKLRQDGQLNKVEIVMHAIEQVSSLLTSGFDGQINDGIVSMCQHLKIYGACLEVIYKDQLDRAFVVFRNSSQDEEKLDYQSRLHLLELIELRANQWKGTDYMCQYYKKKIDAHRDTDTISTSDSLSSMSLDTTTLLSPISAPLLGPGEIMKSSGKFPKPTRIPGKNYCKDEVVIRNADSGKVMGIKGRRVHMIEELSETIISFQRVNPGAKERLVQITGANESSINHAKQLIEDTIRRNASPIRDPNAGVGNLAGSSSSLNSSASDDSAPLGGHMPRGNLHHSLSTGDASVGEYKYTVNVKGHHSLKITGHNLDLVKMGKLVLEEFFSGEPINGMGEFFSFETLPRSPLSPHDPIGTDLSTTLSNGQTDQPIMSTIEEPVSDYKPLRRPNLSSTEFGMAKQNVSREDPVKEIPICSGEETLKDVEASIGVNKEYTRIIYSIELLSRMALSPMCVCPPNDWARIADEHPNITRSVVEIFDVDLYLSNRATNAHTLCTSASDDSILSGSSV